jgi:hypothetical protein
MFSLKKIMWTNEKLTKEQFVEVRGTNSEGRICKFRALRRKDSKAQHKLPPAPESAGQ